MRTVYGRFYDFGRDSRGRAWVVPATPLLRTTTNRRGVTVWEVVGYPAYRFCPVPYLLEGMAFLTEQQMARKGLKE